MNKYIEKTAF